MYNAFVRIACVFLSPAMPVVKRLFGRWHIEEFVDNHKWKTRHPSLILSTSRKEYDRDIALMTVDLLRRWVYSVYSKDDVVLPAGFTLRKTISYRDDQPPLIAVVVDEYNTAFIIFRGTLTLHDLLVSTWDMHATGLPPGPETVHSGYKHVADNCFRAVLAELVSMPRPNNLVVVGHSLGASVGILVAQNLWLRGFDPIVYTYGAPRFTSGEEEYPFAINTVICSEDSIALGNLFPKYKHIGAITFTSGVSAAPHTIDSYYSSIFFDADRTDACKVEDLDNCMIVD